MTRLALGAARRRTVLACVLGAWFAVAAATQESAPGTPTEVAITGRVVDSAGRPIEGAGVVFAVDEDTVTAEVLADAAVRTDRLGQFSLAVPARAAEGEAAVPALIVAAAGHAAIRRSVRWAHEDAPNDTPTHLRVRKPHALGDLVLANGVRLFGRVRDAAGKPVAGAAVIATDMLDNHRQLPGSNLGSWCRAVSDRSGIFKLPATLPNAVQLSVAAPGYLRRQLGPVDLGTPLEIALVAGGTIQGRVLDAEGRGLAGARVTVAYERRGETSRAFAGVDGSFELPLDYAARYRLSVYLPPQPEATQPEARPAMRGVSAVLEGPQANLELFAKPAASAARPENYFVVEAESAATGKALTAIRAAVVWNEHAQQNPQYLEYLLEQGFRRRKTSEAAVQLQGPGETESTMGIVRVTAAGFAPTTVRDFEWTELDEGATRPALKVRMVAASSIAGRVVDERSGDPVVGAKVWAVPQFDSNMGFNLGATGPPDFAVETGPDGSYEIAGLGEGKWSLKVVHAARPPVAPRTIQLAAVEALADVEVRAPAGARVAGRVTGLGLPAGARVFLHPIPRVRFGTNQYYYSSQQSSVPADALPLGPDGEFAFDGVALEYFVLMLELPSPPRCGASLVLPIDAIRVRADGVARDFDASADEPIPLRGTLAFPAARPPMQRLVVVAEEVDLSPDAQRFNTSPQQAVGPRAFVQADGSFELRVAPGHHRLKVVDVGLGLILASLDDPVEVKAAAGATCALTVAVAECSVRLTPERDGDRLAEVDRLEVRFTPKQPPNAGGIVFGNNDNYDQGVGLPWPEGTKEVRFWAPEGAVAVLARNNISQIRVDRERHNVPPLGRGEAEVVPAAGAALEIAVEVCAPREVPEDPAEGDK